MDARALALKRACQVAGGAEGLAARMDLSPRTVRAMLEGKVPIPPRLFLDLVDVITAADLAGTRRRTKSFNTTRDTWHEF
jgi:DNA-binding transcriptional regulator YdaS (Cro superfamily)